MKVHPGGQPLGDDEGRQAAQADLLVLHHRGLGPAPGLRESTVETTPSRSASRATATAGAELTSSGTNPNQGKVAS
nr:hypothetical protein [Nonomuraea basaltis]